MVDAVTTLVDLIIATLLYVQATVFRSRALTALGSGFVFTALILVPHVLTFPGAFAPGGLLGAGTSTTAWLYVFWRAAFPTAVLLYVLSLSGGRVGAARTGTAGGECGPGAACGHCPGGSGDGPDDGRPRLAAAALSSIAPKRFSPIWSRPMR